MPINEKSIMNNIGENLDNISTQIRTLESKYLRDQDSVTLLAVSKTKPISDIQAAIDWGQTDFGENYVDEAINKIQFLENQNCCWHYIGHIQSNKTKLIAEHFDWVHTIDRLKIAKRLSMQRPESLDPINSCIQLNIDMEASKSGIAVSELAPLCEQIAQLKGIKLRGLMAIPAPRSDLSAQQDVLAKVREALESVSKTFPDLDTLSMGMSGDMEAAIAEGSTIVRIGTAIFGSRNKPL